MKAAIFTSALLLTTSLAQAAKYDDWDAVTVNITQAVQHFGGNYTCKYNQYRFGYNIYNPGYYGYYTQEKFHSTHIADSITARPALPVQDLAEYLGHGGIPINDPYYIYRCDGTADLAKTYIEQKVVGTRIEYRPRAPFPTYAQYEFFSCTNYTRNGSLIISGVAGASQMVVKDITGSSPITIYSGPAGSYINYATSAHGGRELSIKLDSGSSYYLHINVPRCSPGGGGVQPL
ncbi:hypothetical protein M2404_001320 [Rheinheimera pacifica]|uniref:hypothetical protein n=1 Tax=Rheinheimera pacifica TaxID=173990 RepID=UPI00216904CE|nr:hypothetical protein [Rheinheimera pacifica]MCS4306995.1 hypothetical protein [Rheinheimera pacifica]